jgi:hypothetical protein
MVCTMQREGRAQAKAYEVSSRKGEEGEEVEYKVLHTILMQCLSVTNGGATYVIPRHKRKTYTVTTQQRSTTLYHCRKAVRTYQATSSAVVDRAIETSQIRSFLLWVISSVRCDRVARGGNSLELIIT